MRVVGYLRMTKGDVVNLQIYACRVLIKKRLKGGKRRLKGGGGEEVWKRLRAGLREKKGKQAG